MHPGIYVHLVLCAKILSSSLTSGVGGRVV